MKFYNQPHRFYCGIDLHARTLAVCALDADGARAFRGTVAACPKAVRDARAPFRENLAVACAGLFAWYWLADLGEQEPIPFVLGHALYMKALHGGMAKHDALPTRPLEDSAAESADRKGQAELRRGAAGRTGASAGRAPARCPTPGTPAPGEHRCARDPDPAGWSGPWRSFGTSEIGSDALGPSPAAALPPRPG